MGMKSGPVHLHIERLVLEGYSPRNGRLVAQALERELGRLVRERGLPANLESRPSLVARPVPAAAGLPPRTVGARLARSVYGALGGKGGKGRAG